MKKKNILSVLLSVGISVFFVTTLTYAATSNLESLRVGTAGGGGVTFFNGTILNESSSEPLTIGDDLRVDGRVWRGASAGTSDSQPFIINDNAEVAGSLTVGSTNVLDAIDGKASSDDVVSQSSPEWDTRTGYSVTPATMFNAVNSEDQYLQHQDGILSQEADGSVFVGPLVLPHGALLQDVEIVYQDNSTTSATISLIETELNSGTSSGASSILDSESTSGQTLTLNSMTLSPSSAETVDNQTKTYSISFSSPNDSDLIMVKAIARYTYTQPY